MHAMAISTYPMASSEEVGKAFLESVKDPHPDYVTRIGLYSLFGGKGIKTYTLYEVAREHADEAMKELVNRQISFGRVQGYEVTLEWVLTAEETLPMIGLQM